MSYCRQLSYNSIIPLTHTHPFNGPFSRTTQVSRYQKGKANLDFTEATDSEWQWHQLGHMHICTSLQTDNHASTPPLSFLQTRCPSCHPTNSVKALKAIKPLNIFLNFTNCFHRFVTDMTCLLCTTHVTYIPQDVDVILSINKMFSKEDRLLIKVLKSWKRIWWA